MSEVGATVPKTITRIKSEYYGFPVTYLILVFSLALCSVFIIAGALTVASSILKAVLLVIMFMIILVFTLFFRSPSVMTRSMLMWKYFNRSVLGKNLIAKYNVSAALLGDNIVPIKAFHEQGIIEFLGNNYGVLMRIEPSRISDDELDSHIAKGRGLVDALHGDLLMKFYIVSINSNDVAIEKNVIDIINKEERSQKQKEHLYSLYHHLQDSTKSVIQWQFYIFIGMGEYKSVENAKIALSQYMPGIESKLQKSGVKVVQIQDKNTLALAYRQCLTTHGGI